MDTMRSRPTPQGTSVRRAAIISDTTKEHKSVWEQGVLKV